MAAPRRLDASAWSIAAAWIGATVLPWHLLQDGLSWRNAFAMFGEDPDTASALAQAMVHGRWWFWPIFAALVVATPAMLPAISRPLRARALLVAGAFGLAAFIAQGWCIGVRGWAYPELAALFGEMDDRQFGVGSGGALTFFALVWLFTSGLALLGRFGGDRFVAGSVGVLVAVIGIFTVWPVATILTQAFHTSDSLGLVATLLDRFLGTKIWGIACLHSSANCGVAWNTLGLACATAAGCTALGLAFALIVIRTDFPFRRIMRALTVLPIITPPFVIGLGMILIFGRSGIINHLIEVTFGIELGRWIYGFNGVLLAQVFSFTPTAFLVLIGVVQGISPSMEEAAQMLRADRTRTFRAVTLPLMRPGLANAFLVVFVESLADFGNPVVLGGSFGVLSTEIYFAVVGAQADFGRAATLAFILLAFALAVFTLQRSVVGRSSYVSVTGKGDVGLVQPLPDWVRRTAYAIAVPWATLTIAVYGLALTGGFVKIWGRDWTPTLSHFARAFAVDWANGAIIWSGGAWMSVFTTMELAAISAPITAALGLTAAWLLSRQQFAGKTAFEFALMLTFCVPGTVIGVAYIFTFNIPPVEITGTAIVLIACFVFRNLPVGVRSGMAAMSQLDKSLDEAAMTLRASTFRTLRTVVLPLLKPAIVTALVYSFVRSVTTVSAVIFLVSAQHEMATVFIINRVINGDYGIAIAYSTVLIVLMFAVIALIQLVVGERNLGRRKAVAPIALPLAGERV